jgi:molybdate transport repressor ModE-like protein
VSSRITVEDLRLVEAVGRHGSVGAAARELLVSQPAASKRLAALERRVGATLFDRDTTGARPTAAGRELTTQGGHLLARLESLAERTLAAAGSRSLSVGTIPSLASLVFTALEAELDGVVVQPEVEHGPLLARSVADGGLDAAVVTISDQAVLPRGLVSTRVGRSPLVTLVPDGADAPGTGRGAYAGRTVFSCTVDNAGEVLHRRLTDLGATARPAATAETAVRMARLRRCLAVVPELLARWHTAPGDRVVPGPLPGETRISLVTRAPVPGDLADVLPRLRDRLLGT